MLTQVELEQETFAYGVERMRKAIDRNEEKGGAPNNPYAQAIYRRFVLPLAEIIKADVENPRIGRSQAHVPLLKGMDYDAVAFLAVRSTLVVLCQDKGEVRSGRDVLKAIGTAVYHEHLLTQFADAEPTLFYHLLNDMDRRMSVNETHRMTVMKMQGRKNGVTFKEWGCGERDQVGSYLADQLMSLGMVEVGIFADHNKGKLVTVVQARLKEDVQKLIGQITDFVSLNTPYFLPCVEPPKDWVAPDDGGFHTQEMRRLSPWMVKAHVYCRSDYNADQLRTEMRAINALQQVRWRINKRMLDAITNVAQVHDMEEIIAYAESPKPVKPMWLTKELTKEMMDEKQQHEFKMWKREVAEWHTGEKKRAGKSNRFYNSMRVARKFVDYDAIYFVYFADFRGRKYVQTTGVSPQGSDLQKALLEFADGKPLLTKEAKDWFCIAGANRWGYDKASLEDRVKWVKENEEMILAFASDPVNNSEWKSADKPLQFLAWCMEYEQWVVFGDAFKSRIAVGMDGSCNGLQNFSAMLRDAEGGRATNLVPSKLPNDIYQLVADRLRALLMDEQEDDAGFRTKWITHGLSRDLVKRSVMTLPYGSRQSSWAEFIVSDYLREGKFPELDKRVYEQAARFLSARLAVAIADVVVAATGAMEWLQKASSAILRQGYDTIRWITPSGFPVVQTYWEENLHRINTKLCGGAKLSFTRETDEPKKTRHRNGIAPNFVHSLDASHLTLVVNKAKEAGVDAFAMIHDDYGTHAADTATLYRIIREVFVSMYQQHDVLESFRAAYGFLPEPPPMGSLDLTQVLDSPYFFS